MKIYTYNNICTFLYAYYTSIKAFQNTLSILIICNVFLLLHIKHFHSYNFRLRYNILPLDGKLLGSRLGLLTLQRLAYISPQEILDDLAIETLMA